MLWQRCSQGAMDGLYEDKGGGWSVKTSDKTRRQEEKGIIEDEMVGRHHQLNGHESGWTPGIGDGQGGLVCCASWGCKESNTTDLIWIIILKVCILSWYLCVVYCFVCGIIPFVNKTIISPLCILATLSKARWLCIWDVLSHSVLSNSLQLHELYLAKFLCPWGFSRQEYWSGLACPPPGDLPNPGIKSRSPVLQVDSLPSEPPGKPKSL